MAGCVRSAWKKYLVHFAHDHLEFRIPELLAACSLSNVEVDIPKEYDSTNPFLEIELPSDNVACQVMSRLVLGKSIYELWGKATSVDDLLTCLQSSNISNPCSSAQTSFKIEVECFNKTQTQDDKLDRIQKILSVDELKFNGRVNLSKPQHKFSLMEFYEYDSVNRKENPQYVYFGRWLSDSLRHDVRKYNLQERKFIANTSMDPTLSLLMANMGQVKANDLVFDPFVGSGGLLVSCAHFGAYVMGTDIDYNLLHARGKPSRKGQKWRFRDETIHNNLRQYGLERHYIDAFVADFTSYSLWRTDQLRFDAIVTDPPYGVREPSQKLGKHKQSKCKQEDREEVVPQSSAVNCFPTKMSYHLTDMLLDLLNFAARTLTLGGRLVFWMPIVRDIYVSENIPCHPCLKLISNSEQIFFPRVSRRLITMEKIQDFKEDSGAAYVDRDHYAGSEFRDIFFTPNENASKKPKIGSQSKT